MKGYKPAVFVPLLLVAACSIAAQPGVSSEEAALAVLEKRLSAENLYPDGCIQIFPETAEQEGAAAPARFDFAVHEKHGDGCPGDPGTSPVRDRFAVEAETGSLLWMDFTSGDYVAFEEREKILSAGEE
ncbi:hypothetical protein LK996_02210 [Lysobacter sp. A6]|uniref:Lipoprotein n=1 Tax=Noviluteimonas lactosilytica TaxID=2888523 RepID=A0ABS8JEA9_9GAMM|nr:hypothetical protein [Lysobacter lactosilyticus]MCC8361898.1 hypothetical protein [Lysobacter lactosilyticus]